jgi:hypothetical protein
MRKCLQISFGQAEFLAMLLDKQIEIFSTIRQPGKLNDFLAVNSFITGENLPQEEQAEERADEVIDKFEDMVEMMKGIRSQIRENFGI